MKLKNSTLVLCLMMAWQANAATGSTTCGVENLNCPTVVDQNPPAVKDMLTWNQQDRVIGFRNDYRSYTGDVFKAGDQAKPIARAIQDLSTVVYHYDDKQYTLTDYIKRNDVTGMMVIKNGQIVWQYYGKGNNDTTLWTSRSVGKSVISTLVGIALKEGKIQSLDDLVIKYNPDVKGTAWENVTIRQLLQHTSGVEWGEDYTDPNSDFAKLTQCEATDQAYQCVNALVKSPERKAYAKPGEAWSYSSGGAWLLGDTLEKATGESVAQYLQEKIWQPFGMVHDGVWHSYEKGQHDVGAHGFNAVLEDWGKFGLFIASDGTLPDGTKILPDHWVKEARTWNQAENSITPSHPDGSYGYEWWNNRIPANLTTTNPNVLKSSDTLWALGIFGQMIMVNQVENLVIVQWSTWPKAEPSFSAQPLESALMFNSIAAKLQ
ncbi:CubicO group peptidase (beta-lactamase class C family) [Orbus hercynius]|uniref:CubicO group peptidase (Beta-lactamase class C family) n=1 Tax=Orbus hercynius TaxID=593135 RepID=A0A495RJR0_9GAMM|nr:serine hydrolase [Orbus hercynius]RKS87530.1 CubicO group peptidase (beta-lactamase class C family) [Orbus hercynius]